MGLVWICVIGTVGLSACGQKGPLYLPGPGSPIKEKPVSAPVQPLPR
ncbi:MAG: hypothetical protein EOP38_26125 [Rubrivivax sp.]|nr:MAG: hypothetical protein EOP38_26125 [Rubrivivax sp.]